MYPTETINLSGHHEPTDDKKHEFDHEESKDFFGNVYLTKLTFTLPPDQYLPSLWVMYFKCAMTTDSCFNGYLPTLLNKKDSESERDMALKTLLFDISIRVQRG
jgi:hypothetical protein